MAKKNDKVAAARKAFVQARVAKTGRTAAEDRAKFRQRFEKLATSPEGRKAIQQITGITGIRKQLKSAYVKPSTTTTTSTTTTSTSTTSNLSNYVNTPAAKTSEARMESGLRASATPKFPASTTRSAQTSTSTTGAQGLSNIQKVLLGGGAAAVATATLRRLNLDRIAKANAANVSTPAKGITSPSPTKKGPTKGPTNRKTTGPRKSSASARYQTRMRGGGSTGGGGGGPRSTDDRQVVQ